MLNSKRSLGVIRAFKIRLQYDSQLLRHLLVFDSVKKVSTSGQFMLLCIVTLTHQTHTTK